MASLVRGSTAVLSACNSGRGTIMSKGDVGVSRSFLAAGASARGGGIFSLEHEG